jgi:hypothetical protein
VTGLGGARHTLGPVPNNRARRFVENNQGYQGDASTGCGHGRRVPIGIWPGIICQLSSTTDSMNPKLKLGLALFALFMFVQENCGTSMIGNGRNGGRPEPTRFSSTAGANRVTQIRLSLSSPREAQTESGLRTLRSSFGRCQRMAATNASRRRIGKLRGNQEPTASRLRETLQTCAPAHHSCHSHSI